MFIMSSQPNRRQFLGSAAAAAAFTIVPRHVLGGPGYVAPSDKITLAYVGSGHAGVARNAALLASPDIQIVAVCDPNQNAEGYRDWDAQRSAGSSAPHPAGSPIGGPAADGTIPGGRDVGQSIVETYYAADSASGRYSRAAPRTPICASCSRRKKTWTRSRS